MHPHCINSKQPIVISGHCYKRATLLTFLPYPILRCCLKALVSFNVSVEFELHKLISFCLRLFRSHTCCGSHLRCGYFTSHIAILCPSLTEVPFELRLLPNTANTSVYCMCCSCTYKRYTSSHCADHLLCFLVINMHRKSTGRNFQ